MRLGKKEVGADQPVFMVAELSANHNGSIEIAKRSIEAAAQAGADAVKIQTYTPDTITIDCDNQYFQINQGTIWDGTTLYKLYQQAYTPYEWHEELFSFALEKGITLFSTPFDHTAVELLEKCKAPFYKIASFEITDLPLIEAVAATGKPVILSTGVAALSDIELAVNCCRRQGNDNLILLKCISAYPAPIDQTNLRTMENLGETFGAEIGLSDHSLGTAVSVAAAALGAVLIERHFILDKNMGGPDASFSLDEEEFRFLVIQVRAARQALGRVTYELTEAQRKSREHSRSLFVVESIQKGDLLTEKNVRSIRPGFGLHTKYYKDVLGRRAAMDLPRGTPLEWGQLV